MIMLVDLDKDGLQKLQPGSGITVILPGHYLDDSEDNIHYLSISMGGGIFAKAEVMNAEHTKISALDPKLIEEVTQKTREQLRRIFHFFSPNRRTEKIIKADLKIIKMGEMCPHCGSESFAFAKRNISGQRSSDGFKIMYPFDCNDCQKEFMLELKEKGYRWAMIKYLEENYPRKTSATKKKADIREEAAVIVF